MRVPSHTDTVAASVNDDRFGDRRIRSRREPGLREAIEGGNVDHPRGPSPVTVTSTQSSETLVSRRFRGWRPTWHGRHGVSRPMSFRLHQVLAVKLDSRGSHGSLPLPPWWTP